MSKILASLTQPNSHFEIFGNDTPDRKAGVYFVEIKKNEKTTYQQYTYVSHYCSVAEVFKSENYTILNFKYRVRNSSGFSIEESLVKPSVFEDKKGKLLKPLIDKGFFISKLSLFLEYIAVSVENAKIRQGTENRGWIDGEYINNGFSTNENSIVYCGSKSYPFEKFGSEEKQKEFLRRILFKNPLAFAIVSYSLTGYFSRFLNEEINQILALIGKSSAGKSNIAKLALSLFTNPDFRVQFDATAGSLKAYLKNANDNFLFIDEIGESKLKPDEKSSFLYSIANGKDRARLSKDATDNFQVKDLDRLFYSVLMTGEKSFLEGSKLTDGLEVRLCEIILDKNTHIFEEFKDLPETEEAKEIESMSREYFANYGHIAPIFINEIQRMKDSIVNDYLAELEKQRGVLENKDAVYLRKVKIIACTNIASKILADIIFEDDLLDSQQAELKEQLLANSNSVLVKTLFNSIAVNNNEEEFQVDTLLQLENTHKKYFHKYDVHFSPVYVSEAQYCLGHFVKNNDGLPTSKYLLDIYTTRIDDFCTILKIQDKKRFLTWLNDFKDDNSKYPVLIVDKGREKSFDKLLNNSTIKQRVYRIDLLQLQAYYYASDDKKEIEIPF